MWWRLFHLRRLRSGWWRGIVAAVALSIAAPYACTNPAPERETSASRSPLPTKVAVSSNWGSAPVIRETRYPGIQSRAALADYLPLIFERNQGQVEPSADFLIRASNYLATVNHSELRITPTTDRSLSKTESHAVVDRSNHPVVIRYSNANPQVEPIGENELAGTINYFRGKTSDEWITGIPTYEFIKLPGLYVNQDLILRSSSRQLELVFLLHPGADPSQIALEIDKADAVRLDEAGAIVLDTSTGPIRLQKPIAYQSSEKGLVDIPARYELTGQTVRFIVSQFDASKPLVIDPVLAYSTYFGDPDTAQRVSHVRADDDGNTYIGGRENRSFAPGNNFFIAKLDPSGSRIVYLSFFDGISDDFLRQMIVDETGNVYGVGHTGSPDFPVTPGAFQTEFMGNYFGTEPQSPFADAFIFKLAPSGKELIYSTFVGGRGTGDDITDIALTPGGAAYVAGKIDAEPRLRAPGAFHQTFGTGSSDIAQLLRVDPNASQIEYSIDVRGDNTTRMSQVAVDESGNAYVAGRTWATNLPVTQGAFQSAYPPPAGNFDGWVAKFGADTSGAPRVVFLTYLGGNHFDSIDDIAVGEAGSVYLSGSTKSTNFPTNNGYQTSCQNCPDEADAFLAKLNATGQVLEYGSFLGGIDVDDINEIAIDNDGYVVAAGGTESVDFPVKDEIQSSIAGETDAFVAKFDTSRAAADSLIFATYFGGNGGGDDRSYDVALSLDVDGRGCIHLGGETLSTEFPLKHPFRGSPTERRLVTGFVAKFAPDGTDSDGDNVPDACDHLNEGALSVIINFILSE